VCRIALTGHRNSVPAASGEVCPVLTRRAQGHRTLRPASDGHRPVVRRFENLSAYESGGHRTRPVPHKERPVTPRRAHITRAREFSSRQFLFFSHTADSPPCPSSPKSPPPPSSKFSSVIRSSPWPDLFPGVSSSLSSPVVPFLQVS